MNPAEKVKAILDELIAPLYKDDPFGQGGRKITIDGSCTDVHTLTFQAFVNRVSTFKPGEWSSDPNAAVYLAKHGFKAVSKCKIRCCSCGVEIDMGVFLGKREVLRAIALKTHKQYCRWLHVSTPEAYFAIAKNPRRCLDDLKITFTEMTTFQTKLPLILKDNWMKMGISEAFMTSVFNFLELTYSDTFASCVVLSLCGWVKRDAQSLQCNFCQRVAAVWNFISDGVKKSNMPVGRSSKPSRIVSLLYSKIRCSKELSEHSEIADFVCQGTTDPTVEPSNIEQTNLDSNNENELNQKGIIGSNSSVGHESIYGYLEQDSVEREVVDGKYKIVSDHSSDQLSSGSDSNDFGNKRGFRNAQKIKRKAPKCLWKKSKRVRTRTKFVQIKNVHEKHLYKNTTSDEYNSEHEQMNYNDKSKYYKVGRKCHKVKNSVCSAGKKCYKSCSREQKLCKIERGIYEVERKLCKATRDICGVETGICNAEICECGANTDICGTETQTDLVMKDCSDVCSYSVCDNSEKKLSIANVNYKGNNGASSSRNCFNHTEQNVRKETCSKSVKPVSISPEYGAIVIVSKKKPKPSKDSHVSANKGSAHPDTRTKSKCSPCKYSLRNKCASGRECVVEVQKLTSCDISANNHNESQINLGGGRKRKRVPKNERNGSPCGSGLLPQLPAQMEPAHFTRSKKKEMEMRLFHTPKPPKDSSMEMMLFHTPKPPKASSSKDNGTEVINLLSSEGETASEGSSKTHSSREDDKNNKDADDNMVILSNNEDCTDLAPVICSVIGNAVIPDTSEDDDCVDPEMQISKGPIIVSAKSVCEEGMLQDYVEEEGRKFANGCRQNFNGISSNESPIVKSPEKSVQNVNARKLYDALEDTSAEENSKESPPHERRRIETTEDSEPPIVKRPEKSVQNVNARKFYDALEDTSAAENSKESPPHGRRRIETTEDSEQPRSVPVVDNFINRLTPSYFHPELEHRYWCLWRLKFADCMKQNGCKTGWELYMAAIQEGLKFQNAERVRIIEAENNALDCLADIVAITKQRSK